MNVILKIALPLLGLWLAGCAGGPAPVEDGRSNPGTYVVMRGDTLHQIAWRFGLDYRDIARWNGLRNPDLIYPGQRLRLNGTGEGRVARVDPLPEPPRVSRQRPEPQAQSPRPAAPPPRQVARVETPPAPRAAAPPKPAAAQPAAVSKPATVARTGSGQRQVAGLNWQWPTQGQVELGFKPDVPGRKGIRIGGRLGQGIQAASNGTVVYSGSGLPGYGRLIIVKHSDTLLSAYGYLGRILVEEGDTVTAGQPIAEMGVSSESRPALHFEVRQNGEPTDPLRFLPG